MTIGIVSRSSNHRAALGDRTNGLTTLSANDNGNLNPAILPLRTQRKLQVFVNEASATTVTSIDASESMGKIKDVTEHDKVIDHLTTMKLVEDFSNLTLDEIASDYRSISTGGDGRPSLVSPAYSEEHFDGDDNGTDDDQEVLKKFRNSSDPNGYSKTVTSETDEHAKAVSNEYVFSDAFVESSARKVLRPLEGESAVDAMKNIKKICLKAMHNAGKDWKSIIEGKDKYNLLSAEEIKSKIILKTLFVLGVLDVVGDTMSSNMPPAIMKSCSLGRKRAIEWIGANKIEDMWIPKTGTIYQWYSDFTNGRFFRHPEFALHTEMQSLDRLDEFFSMHPARKRAFKAHVQSVLQEQRASIRDLCHEDADTMVVRDGTLLGNAYDFYCYFVNDILREASKNTSESNRGTNEIKEAGSTKESVELEHRLAFFSFERLTWQHMNTWMSRTWGTARHMADPS